MKRKIALELYSIGNDFAADPFGTLEKVAQMGYTGVEFAGIPDVDHDELLKLMNKLDLETTSAHIGFEILSNDDELKKAIAFLKKMSAKHIVCPYTPFDNVKDAKETGAKLKEIAKKVIAEGLTLSYHNHANEFKPDNGVLPIDIMIDETEGLVKQQPDIFWVAYAETDVYDYLEKHADRIPTIHLKQLGDTSDKKNVDACDGVLDFKRIMDRYPDKIYIYEQEEYPSTPMESVKRSIEFMLSL